MLSSNGQLNAGWRMPLMFDASDLEAGMYQRRIHSKNFVTSKKLLVSHQGNFMPPSVGAANVTEHEP